MKLTTGEPGDIFEREADTVARQIVKRQRILSIKANQPLDLTPVPIREMVQRQETSFPADSEEQLKQDEKLQAKGKASADVSSSQTQTPSLERALAATQLSGQVLPRSAKEPMHRGFGVCFDDVRIHTDAEAARLNRVLNAEAFTYRNHIYFGQGKFDYSTEPGLELLAHELTHTLQQNGLRRKVIQFRGGAKVGDLSINTNVISAGLTAGHAWLGYTPVGGIQTTYGTWGNRPHIGLNRDLELTYSPAATRTTELDSSDYSSLTSFAAANDEWSYTNNCASFARRGWLSVAGEYLDYSTFLIPNPSALGAGIFKANGGATGILAATAPTPGSSSI